MRPFRLAKHEEAQWVGHRRVEPFAYEEFIKPHTKSWRSRLLRHAYDLDDPALKPHLETVPGKFSPSLGVYRLMDGAIRSMSEAEWDVVRFFRGFPLESVHRVDVNLAAIPARLSDEEVLARSRDEIAKFERYIRRVLKDDSFYFKPEWILKKAKDVEGYYRDHRWRRGMADDEVVWHLHVHGVVYVPLEVPPGIIKAEWDRVWSSGSPRNPSERRKDARDRARRTGLFAVWQERWRSGARVTENGRADVVDLGQHAARDHIRAVISHTKSGKRSSYGGPRQISIGSAAAQFSDTKKSRMPRGDQIESALGYCLKRHFRPLDPERPEAYFATWMKLELATMMDAAFSIRGRLRAARYRCPDCGACYDDARHACHDGEREVPRLP